nr:oleosin S1-2 [Tanacetum cinerariifolium]
MLSIKKEPVRRVLKPKPREPPSDGQLEKFLLSGSGLGNRDIDYAPAVTSPLLIIFSPLIAGAIFVLGAALLGFAAAGLMAIAGFAALGWVLKTVKGEEGGLNLNLQSGVNKLLDYGENVKENVKDTGRDLAGDLKETVQNSTDDKSDKIKASRA